MIVYNFHNSHNCLAFLIFFFFKFTKMKVLPHTCSWRLYPLITWEKERNIFARIQVKGLDLKHNWLLKVTSTTWFLKNYKYNLAQQFQNWRVQFGYPWTFLLGPPIDMPQYKHKKCVGNYWISNCVLLQFLQHLQCIWLVTSSEKKIAWWFLLFPCYTR